MKFNICQYIFINKFLQFYVVKGLKEIFVKLILIHFSFILVNKFCLVVRGLPQMQKVVGSNPTDGKICFSQFTLFYRVECEELFCKTNIKLKCIKIN